MLSLFKVKDDYESMRYHQTGKSDSCPCQCSQDQFVPADNTPYWIVASRIMRLLRLSLTADPSDRGFVPGLAIKWLINRNPSEDFFLHLSP